MTSRFFTLLIGLAFAAGCTAEGVGDGAGASTVVTSDCTVDGFGTLPVGDGFEGSAMGLPDGFAEGTWVHLGPETVVPGDCDCDDDDDDDGDDDDDDCRGDGHDDDCDDDDECRGRGRGHGHHRGEGRGHDHHRGEGRGHDHDCDDDDDGHRGRGHDHHRGEGRGHDCDDDRGHGHDDDCDDDDDECRDRDHRDHDWGDHRGEGHGVCECEDEVTRDRFEGEVEAVTCFINGSRIGTVEGSGSWNGVAGYTFEVGVVDSGVSNDEYTFTVYDSTDAVVYTVNGFPDSGDLTVVDY